jgi:hypothetical protein
MWTVLPLLLCFHDAIPGGAVIIDGIFNFVRNSM